MWHDEDSLHRSNESGMPKTPHAAEPTIAGTVDCAFCALRDGPQAIMRNRLSLAVWNTTPVTPLHTLVLPYRHAPPQPTVSFAGCVSIS
jgi:hypothetical protein